MEPKDEIYSEGATSDIYTFPVRRPFDKPARRRDPRRKYTEFG